MLNRGTIRTSEHAMQIVAYVRVSTVGSVSGSSILTNERWKLFLEQSISGFPEDLCRDGLGELHTLVIVLACRWILVLKMNLPEIRVVIIAVPSAVEARIRVVIMNLVVDCITVEAPLDAEFWSLGSSWRTYSIWINGRP